MAVIRNKGNYISNDRFGFNDVEDDKLFCWCIFLVAEQKVLPLKKVKTGVAVYSCATLSLAFSKPLMSSFITSLTGFIVFMSDAI